MAWQGWQVTKVAVWLSLSWPSARPSTRPRPFPCAAPEVAAGGVYQGRQADVWALGVSLYLFIFGELPFKVGGAGWGGGPAGRLLGRGVPSL